MMVNLYEVDRTDYKYFVRGLNLSKCEVKEVQVDRWHKATKIFSKDRNICLASRLTHTIEGEDREPEKYFIFASPTADESVPPTPVAELKLETKEEVQAFFDALSKYQKEHKND